MYIYVHSCSKYSSAEFSNSGKMMHIKGNTGGCWIIHIFIRPNNVPEGQPYGS